MYGPMRALRVPCSCNRSRNIQVKAPDGLLKNKKTDSVVAYMRKCMQIVTPQETPPVDAKCEVAFQGHDWKAGQAGSQGDGVVM